MKVTSISDGLFGNQYDIYSGGKDIKKFSRSLSPIANGPQSDFA